MNTINFVVLKLILLLNSLFFQLVLKGWVLTVSLSHDDDNVGKAAQLAQEAGAVCLHKSIGAPSALGCCTGPS